MVAYTVDVSPDVASWGAQAARFRVFVPLAAILILSGAAESDEYAPVLPIVLRVAVDEALLVPAGPDADEGYSTLHGGQGALLAGEAAYIGSGFALAHGKAQCDIRF